MHSSLFYKAVHIVALISLLFTTISPALAAPAVPAFSSATTADALFPKRILQEPVLAFLNALRSSFVEPTASNPAATLPAKHTSSSAFPDAELSTYKPGNPDLRNKALTTAVVTNTLYLPLLLRNGDSAANPDAEVEVLITPETGGSLTSNDGNVTVDVPAGAVKTPIYLRYTPQSQPTVLSGPTIQDQFSLEANQVADNSPVKTFDLPVQISVQPTNSITNTHWTLASWNSIVGWQALPTIYDPALQQFSAQTMQTSTFALKTKIIAAAITQLAPPIPETPYSQPLPFTFLISTTTHLHNANDTVLLSSTSDGSGAISTDDYVAIYFLTSGGVYTKNHSAYGPGITEFPPTDVTNLLVSGNNTIKIELVNLIAPVYSTKGYYLVGIDKNLGDIVPPTIFNVTRWMNGQGNVIIRAQVFDASGVGNVTLLFNGSAITMIPVGGGFYQAIVPSNIGQINSFQITATDTVGNPGFFPNATTSADFLGYQSRRLGWGVCKDSGCPPGQCGCDADPVNTSNGNFTDRVTDLVIPGIGDTELRIERGYNSLPNEPLGVIRYKATDSGVEQEAINAHPEPFGPGWTSPLMTSLIVMTYTTPNTAQVRYADGHTAEFEDSGGGAFTAFEPRVYDTLTGDSSGYTLTRKNGTEYHFDTDGDLTEIIDRNDNTVTLTYDGEKRLIRADNSAGYGLEFAYNDTNPDLITDIYASLDRHLHYEYDDGHLIEATDPNGNVTTYEYDGGRLSKVTLPDNKPSLAIKYDSTLGLATEQTMGDTATYTFDYNGLTTTMTDNLNHTTTHVYDADYRIIELHDEDGNTEYFNYDADEQRIFFQDKNGNQWHYDYDNQGNLLERRDPVDSCGLDPTAEDVTTWTYNNYGQVTSMLTALGHTWLYIYDAAGNLTKVIAPDQSETNLVYDERGLPIKITDSLERVTRFAYDTFGNLERTVDATGHLSLSSYDLAGREVAFTDANDHTVYFDYDHNSNLTRIADAKQQVTTFTYDANNQLISSRDRRGVVSDFEYNKYLQLTGERDFPDGQWQRYAYDALHRQERVTDRLGYVTHYGYDELNRLETVTDPLGAVTRYGYDANGNLNKITDKLNAATEIKYDAANRVKVLTDAAGYTTEYCYDVEDRLLQVIDTRGGVTGYSYDKLDRLTAITDPLGATTRYEYDSEGNRTAVIDAAGRRTEYVYDKLNRLTSLVRPGLPGDLHPTTTFGYDPVGNIIAITSPRGFVTTFTYDDNDNLATITDPLNGQVSYTYDAEDNPLTVTDPNGHTTTTSYDPVGLPLRIEDPLAHVTRFEYDAAYNLVKVINAQDRPTLYDYDPLQRLVRQTDPLGNMTHYKRDARGQVTAMADAKGQTTRYSYDLLGRLVTVTDALAGLTHYEYDPAGNLAAITDAKDQVTRFAYDLRNQLTKEVNPLDNSWHYGYDAVGNLVRRVDAEQQVTLYHYDSNDRLIKIDYPAADVLFAYDLDGNETQMCDWLGCTGHTYDPLGRQTATTDWLGRTIARSYDPAGNLTGLTYPNGYQVGYSYDANDWLTDVTDPHGDVSTYEHNPLGQVTRLLHPNGTVAAFTYDKANRLTGIDNRRMLAAQPQSAYAYALDKVGNRTQVIETRAAFDGSADPVVLTHDYEYDALNRLINAATQAPDSATTYTFDAVGNRLDKSGTVLSPDPGTPELPVAPRPEAVSSSYNAANQLTSVSDPDSTTALTYDRNGNRIREVEVIAAEDKTVVTEYGYDIENRLVAVTKSTNSKVTMTATYTYDGYGRRVRKAVSYPNGGHPNQTLTYLYDNLEIIGVQLEKGGSVTESYYYLASSPITGMRRPYAMERLSSNKRYWYQMDGQDSIVALTGQDGKLVSPFLYDEYGQILVGDTDLQIFTYTAQDYDSETGLYHFYARHYDSHAGVWLTQDRWRGQIFTSSSLHRYQYTYSNPISYYDPTGYWPEFVEKAVNTGSQVVSKSFDSTLKVLDRTAQWVGQNQDTIIKGSLTVAAVAGTAALCAATVGVACIAGAAIGAVAGAGGELITQVVQQNGDTSNIDFKAVGIAALSGGITGAISTVIPSFSGIKTIPKAIRLAEPLISATIQESTKSIFKGIYGEEMPSAGEFFTNVAITSVTNFVGGKALNHFFPKVRGPRYYSTREYAPLKPLTKMFGKNATREIWASNVVGEIASSYGGELFLKPMWNDLTTNRTLYSPRTIIGYDEYGHEVYKWDKYVNGYSSQQSYFFNSTNQYCQ
ncbi:MAG: RHS repeat protein [Anaerolineales bacterium]|nr:RHS repeat protein [Anaerolineales bacterium]